MPALPQYLDLAPAWARGMYLALATQIADAEERIMAKVTVEDTDIENLRTALGSIADDLEKELAALNVPAGDLTGVQAIVSRLRNDVPVPTPTPAPAPAPAPTPTPNPTPDPGPAP